MLCSIYKITNQINGKVYIGQTWVGIKKRFRVHKQPSYRGCLKLHSAFEKHGRDNFTIELITLTGTQETADHLEKYFISKYDSISNGYNIREGGSPSTEEIARKLSISQKGRLSPLRGRQQPKDMVARRTKGQKGRKKSPEHVAKMIASLTGRKQTPEHVANMKAAKAARPHKHSEETLAKMRGSRCLSEAQVIELQQSNLSEMDACAKYGISRTTFYGYKRKARLAATEQQSDVAS